MCTLARILVVENGVINTGLVDQNTPMRMFSWPLCLLRFYIPVSGRC